MRDPVTVRLRFDPDTTEAAILAIRGMLDALPKRSKKFSLEVETTSEELEARLQAAFAVSKAQIAVRAKRRKQQ